MADKTYDLYGAFSYMRSQGYVPFKIDYMCRVNEEVYTFHFADWDCKEIPTEETTRKIRECGKQIYCIELLLSDKTKRIEVRLVDDELMNNCCCCCSN